ncbi:5041_t:CDS:2 [Funneliformis geosporum]|nr:5041_t:CDS:2 [Funneliformis geosporum]
MPSYTFDRALQKISEEVEQVRKQLEEEEEFGYEEQLKEEELSYDK